MTISETIRKYIPLRREGREWVGICPFHNDTKPSLKVNDEKGIFKCFVCGTGGGTKAFIQKYNALMGTEHKAPDRTKLSKRNIEEWKPITPVPVDADPPTFRHIQYNVPNRTWMYTDADGRRMFYVCRFNLKDRKEVLPYTYCTNGKQSKWVWKGFNGLRPLYNLPNVVAHETVVLVEGEKTAYAGIKNSSMAFTCWAGGSKGWTKTDFTPMRGKTVYLIPDNDQPGYECMEAIRKVLEALSCKVYLVDVKRYSSIPKWDIADQEWGKNELDSFILYYKS